MQRELFADFVEARDAEVFAFKQVVAGAADEFADRREAEADKYKEKTAQSGPRHELASGLVPHLFSSCNAVQVM